MCRNQAFLCDCGSPQLNHMMTDLQRVEPYLDTPYITARTIAVATRPYLILLHPLYLSDLIYCSPLHYSHQSLMPLDCSWTRNVPDTLASWDLHLKRHSPCSCTAPRTFFKSSLKCPLRMTPSLDTCLKLPSLSSVSLPLTYYLGIIYPPSFPTSLLNFSPQYLSHLTYLFIVCPSHQHVSSMEEKLLCVYSLLYSGAQNST